MRILIYIGLAHSLFLALLLFTKKKKHAHDRALGRLFLVLAAAYGAAVLSLQSDPDWLLFLVNANLLLAPCFYLYVSALIGEDIGIRRQWRHFAPYLLSWLILIWIGIDQGASGLDRLFTEASLVKRGVLFNAFYFAEFLVVPFYLAWTFRLLHQHQKRMGRLFSYSEGVSLAWVRTLAAGIAGFWLLISIPDALNLHVRIFEDDQLLRVGFGSGTLLVFVLGFLGLKQGAIIVNAESLVRNRLDTTPKYRASGLKQDQIQRMAQSLTALMDRHKPHLDSKLTAPDLAARLGVSSHHLSQILNLSLKCNFFDFVNGYRVSDFQKAVVQPENRHKTILAVALECGFHSKSSFNRIFKKETGTTPSRFVKSQQPG